MPDYQLATGSAISDTAEQRIRQGVRDFGAAVIGEAGFSSLHVYARDPDGSLVGGLVAGTYWSWLHVESLWVSEQHRRKGYGSRLLSVAELEAASRGCRNAFLDTFSFQARPLYERLGYRVIGTIPDFPPHHERYFMIKSIAGNSSA
jgi:GNAT superfamily N-acetyltransferase